MMTSDIRASLQETTSPLQVKLTNFCRRRVEAAERRWSQRHDGWREAERIYRAFRSPDDQDKKTRDTPLTQGVQKIVVPYTYATIQSMLAFFMSILTERYPIIPVKGNGPGDVNNAAIMEEVLQYQMNMMDPPGTLILFQWLLDAHRYGVGVIKNLYTIREFTDLVRRFDQVPNPFTGALETIDTVSEEDVIAYEGNEALNVVPYDFLPDPSRPMAEFQRGEFVFHRMRRSYTEMLQRDAEGLYCGVDQIKDSAARTDVDSGREGGQNNQSDLARIADMDDVDDETWDLDVDRRPYVTLHEGWAYIEPEQLAKLGLPNASNSRTPRLWVFTLANRARIVRAEQANLPGRRYPFEIIEPNYDVHSPSNVGLVETIKGLQYHLSWLFNSRMMAVRKTLNNELVVDPAMIEPSDLLDPQPGKLLRLTRAAQNSGLIDKAVFPLPIVDVTAQHINSDARSVREFAEEVSGASRLVMGMPNTGRRAATEVQGQLNLSAGRMKMLAEIVVSQGIRPWATQMSRNTQVFLERSLNLRIQETYAGVMGAQSVQVIPQMLQGNFSFPLLEATMPTDKMLAQQAFRELFTAGMQTGVAAPLLQQINWLQVFARFLESMGIRNLGDFLNTGAPQLQVAPDEQVQQQVQQGNLVPSGTPQGTPSAEGFPMGPTMNGNQPVA